MWLNQNFLLPSESESTRVEAKDWSVMLVSLRDNLNLQLKFEAGTMIIATENMDLAAAIVQSLASYLNLEQLQVNIKFHVK